MDCGLGWQTVEAVTSLTVSEAAAVAALSTNQLAAVFVSESGSDANNGLSFVADDPCRMNPEGAFAPTAEQRRRWIDSRALR